MTTTPAPDRDFSSINVGESCVREHVITRDLIAAFAKLSGDENPLHTDEAYAQSTQFGNVVAHGMLLSSLVSELIGMHLPGRRCLLIKETMEFKLPVFADDTIQIKGTVAHKSEASQLVEIAITISRNDTTVAVGSVHTKILEAHA